MGRATSRDGALQLLLIIDLICEWARDVFRFEIMSCLAGGRDDLRHTSPAATYRSRFSTQEPSNEETVGNPVDQRTQFSTVLASDIDIIDLTETASIADLTLEAVMEVDATMENEPTSVPDESIEAYQEVASHPLLRWARRSPSETSWTAHATIRHSNMCLFIFSYLSLPEDQDSLVACLQQGGGVEKARQTAMYLMHSLLDHTGAVTTTSAHISQLKKQWLRDNEETFNSTELPVRALFSFHTNIRTSDWQILRELRCVSCTIPTLTQLAKIAGLHSERMWTRAHFPIDTNVLSSSTFKGIGSLTGKDGASAALNSTVLYLATGGRDDDQSKCRWISRDASENMSKCISFFAPSNRYRTAVSSLLVRGTTLMEVLKKPLPRDITQSLGPSLMTSRDAILLCKGQHWPQTTSKWCLMVLDEIDFEDIVELTLLLETQAKGDYYTFDFTTSHDEAGEPMEKAVRGCGDEQFLGTWARDLWT